MAFFDRMLDVMKLGEDEDDYYDDDEMYDDDDYDDYDDDDDHSIFHLFGKKDDDEDEEEDYDSEIEDSYDDIEVSRRNRQPRLRQRSHQCALVERVIVQIWKYVL